MRKVRDEKYWDEIEREERDDTEEAIALMLAILTELEADILDEVRLFYGRYGRDGIVTYTRARQYVSNKDHRRKINLLLAALDDALSDGVSHLELELWYIIDEILGREHQAWDADYDSSQYYGVDWLDGRTWKDRLWDDKALWLSTLMTDIKLAMVRGQHLDSLLQQLSKRFKQMGNAINTLVQGETVFLRTHARINLFKQAGIKRYRYYTQEDERVCGTCGPLNDRVFPVTQYEPGVTAPPIHPFADVTYFPRLNCGM